MTTVVGTLVHIVPVTFDPIETDARSPEDQFIAWANDQKVLSPDGAWYGPGVSQDTEHRGEDVTVPFDGIIIDFVEDGEGNQKL